MDLEYTDWSDGYSDLIALSAPFVTRATPMELAIAFGQSRDTVRRYRNGAPTPVERAGRTSTRPMPDGSGRCTAGRAGTSASGSEPRRSGSLAGAGRPPPAG